MRPAVDRFLTKSEYTSNVLFQVFLYVMFLIMRTRKVMIRHLEIASAKLT